MYARSLVHVGTGPANCVCFPTDNYSHQPTMEPLWRMWQMPGFHSENGAKGAVDGDPQCKSELNHSVCPFGGHFEAQL